MIVVMVPQMEHGESDLAWIGCSYSGVSYSACAEDSAQISELIAHWRLGRPVVSVQTVAGDSASTNMRLSERSKGGSAIIPLSFI